MGLHNYSYALPCEKNFDADRNPGYFINNWTDSIWFSLIYVILIFSIQSRMKSQPKCNLRPFLVAWNTLLAVFSLICFIRVFPEFMTSLRVLGLRGSICSKTPFSGVFGYWIYFFALSKLCEFGDTLFIVLRKQNLIFLHWYHHVTTFIFVWYCYAHRMVFPTFSMVMNLFIHTIMYTYYVFKAMKWPVPKHISMVITSLQLCQMFVGTGVLYIGYMAVRQNPACNVIEEAAIAGIMMYISFAVLFAHFFYKAYIKTHTKIN